MSSPTLLVVTLLILWLIVLVPMIFRRVDDGAQARSVRRYGRSMRLLNRRHAIAAGGFDRVSYVAPRITVARDEVFVPGVRGRATEVVEDGRRPTSAGQEGQMYRAELSDARRHMMARRRRSLTILIAGSALSLLLSFVMGGVLLAIAATGFCLGLGGYVYSLRSQALRDRERRSVRTERLHDRSAMAQSHELAEEEYEEYVEFDEVPQTMVRIDDDSIDLHNLDTLDLTGVYTDAEHRLDPRQRRAS